MRLQIILVLIIIGSSLSISAQQKQTTTPAEPLYETQIDSATALLSRAEYVKAEELLRNFPSNDTAYANALYLLSLSYAGQEKFKEAIECSQKGIKLRSAYKRQYYEILGASYDGLKQPEKAMEALKEGLSLFPGYTRFYFQMGVVAKGSSKYEDAAMYYQKAIRGNPFHASSHLNLGLLMYKSNQMIPALLSHYVYLLMDTDVDRSVAALKEIESIGNGEFKIHPDSMLIKNSLESKSFADLEALINSKWALNTDYKSRNNLPYHSVTKTLQIIAEKLEYIPSDTGFTMQFYVPFILNMVKQKTFDASVYFIFRTINNDDVRKELKKQDSNIEKMKTAAADYLNKYRKEQWLAMGLAKYDPWFNNNGILTNEGVYNEKLKVYTGEYRLYWLSGNLRSEGNMSPTGKMNGIWKFYYPEGEPRSIKYYKDDLMIDSLVLFYPSGAIEQVAYYNNDKLHKEERNYYNTLGLKNRIPYDNGVATGEMQYWHQNGQKELTAQIANGNLNGKLLSYHGNGSREKDQVFKNGDLNGPSKTWYENGEIESEGNFVNDLKDGEWKYYHETGGIESSGAFKNDLRTGMWKMYNIYGKLRLEQSYAAGKMEGDATYYDEDGKIWCVFTFSKGATKKYKYFDKQGKILSSGELKGNRLDFNSHYVNGMKFKSMTYINDMREGKSTTWNIFGEIEALENYKNDNLDGKQLYYYDSGVLNVESHYLDGKRNGLYTEYFSNGIIATQGWHVNGSRRGTWYEYRPDGILDESYFYQNGDYQGDYVMYDVTGKPESVIGFNEGTVVSYSGMDTTGNFIYSEKIINGKASFKTLHANKKTGMELNYLNGSLDGTIKSYYCNGKIRWIRNFKNGEKNGFNLEYDWEGNLTDSIYYVDGLRDSTFTIYENGILYFKCDYKNGLLHGKRTWYYPNGKIEIQGNYVHDEQEGHFNYYDDLGVLRYRLLFEHGVLISYSYLAPDSTFVPEIPIPGGTGEVKAFFQNGKPSAEFAYKSSYYQGSFKQYHSNGKLGRESFYKNHEKEGAHKEYNSAGQILADENYLYDNKNGLCRYYTNGVLRSEINYVSNIPHGTAKTYDKSGKLLKKIEMYNGEPCN